MKETPHLGGHFLFVGLGMGWEVGFKAVTDIVQRKGAFSHG